MRSTKSPTATGMRAAFETSKRVRWDIDEGRDPGAPLRYRPQVSSGRAFAGRCVHDPVGRRKAVREPDPGPHLRQHLRAGRALHQCQGPGAEPRSLVRRPGCARGAGSVQRRGVEAPGAVPPHRRDGRRRAARRLSLRRRPQRRRPRRARQEHLGGVGTDARYRAVHPAPLSPEHRSRRRALRTVQGRVPLSLERGKPARDPRRARMGARTTPR